MDIQEMSVVQRKWRSKDLVSGMTAEQMAFKLGCSQDAVRSAARRQGFEVARKPRGYSNSTKARALRLIDSGMTKFRVSKSTGVAVRTLHNWVARRHG